MPTFLQCRNTEFNARLRCPYLDKPKNNKSNENLDDNFAYLSQADVITDCLEGNLYKDESSISTAEYNISSIVNHRFTDEKLLTRLDKLWIPEPNLKFGCYEKTNKRKSF